MCFIPKRSTERQSVYHMWFKSCVMADMVVRNVTAYRRYLCAVITHRMIAGANWLAGRLVWWLVAGRGLVSGITIINLLVIV